MTEHAPEDKKRRIQELKAERALADAKHLEDLRGQERNLLQKMDGYKEELDSENREELDLLNAKLQKLQEEIKRINARKGEPEVATQTETAPPEQARPAAEEATPPPPPEPEQPAAEPSVQEQESVVEPVIEPTPPEPEVVAEPEQTPAPEIVAEQQQPAPETPPEILIDKKALLKEKEKEHTDLVRKRYDKEAEIVELKKAKPADRKESKAHREKLREASAELESLRQSVRTARKEVAKLQAETGTPKTTTENPESAKESGVNQKPPPVVESTAPKQESVFSNLHDIGMVEKYRTAIEANYRGCNFKLKEQLNLESDDPKKLDTLYKIAILGSLITSGRVSPRALARELEIVYGSLNTAVFESAYRMWQHNLGAEGKAAGEEEKKTEPEPGPKKSKVETPPPKPPPKTPPPPHTGKKEDKGKQEKDAGSKKEEKKLTKEQLEKLLIELTAKNFYERLGVNKHATVAEIKKAYRKIPQAFHPDKHPGDLNGLYTQVYQLYQQAFNELTNTASRARYDRTYQSHTPPPGPTGGTRGGTPPPPGGTPPGGARGRGPGGGPRGPDPRDAERIRREQNRADLEARLADARNKYAQAFREFLAQRVNKNAPIPPELERLEKEYDRLAIAYGNSMYDIRRAELEDSGISGAAQDTALRAYKQNEIFTRVIVEEQATLNALKAENLPPKEKNVAQKALDWYLQIKPPWKRILVSSVLATGVFAASFGSVAGLAGVAAYAGTRVGRSLVGMLTSQGAAKAYDLLFKDKSAAERKKLEQELSETFAGESLNASLAKSKKEYASIVEREKGAKRNRLVTKAAFSLAAGGAAAWGVEHLPHGEAPEVSTGQSNTVEQNIAGTTTGPKKVPDFLKPFYENQSGQTADSIKVTGVTPDSTGVGTDSILFKSDTVKVVPDSATAGAPGVAAGTEPPPGAGRVQAEIEDILKSRPEPIVLNQEAIVGQGEGVTHALRRQIENSPELLQKFGFTGDVNNPQAVHEFAGKMAYEKAKEFGYISNDGGEVRVKMPGEVAYQFKTEADGSVKILELDKNGKLTGGVKLDEYEYGHNLETRPVAGEPGAEQVLGTPPEPNFDIVKPKIESPEVIDAAADAKKKLLESYGNTDPASAEAIAGQAGTATRAGVVNDFTSLSPVEKVLRVEEIHKTNLRNIFPGDLEKNWTVLTEKPAKTFIKMDIADTSTKEMAGLVSYINKLQELSDGLKPKGGFIGLSPENTGEYMRRALRFIVINHPERITQVKF